MKNKILFIGDGSQFRVAKSLIDLNLFEITKFRISLKKNIYENKNKVYLKNFFKKNKHFKIFIFIAIGFNYKRKIIADYFDINFKGKFSYKTIISKNSNIASDVKIGKGSIIMPGVTINTNTKIGKHSIINTNSSLDHDNSLGNFSSVGPGVNTGGNVKIGNYTHIGIGSSIKHGISLKSNVVIGGSSFVNKNCNVNSLYYGVPIKFIKKRKVEDEYL